MSRGFDAAINQRQRSFLPQTEQPPQEVPESPVPDAAVEPGSGGPVEPTEAARAPREIPQPKAEQTYDVTVRLAKRHTRHLDRAVADLRFDKDIITSRSDIIRALIELWIQDDHGIRGLVRRRMDL